MNISFPLPPLPPLLPLPLSPLSPLPPREACHASVIQGFLSSFWFAVPPKFITRPKSFVKGVKNWDTVITCDIIGYPTPAITWTRPPKQLSSNRHIIDGKQLTIRNTSESDGGGYVCHGVNSLGNVMAMTWIFVKDVGKKINRKAL